MGESFSFTNFMILLLISGGLTLLIESVRKKTLSRMFNLKAWIVSVFVGFFGSAIFAGILESMNGMNIEFGSKNFYFLFIGISGITYFVWTKYTEKRSEE